MISQGLTASHLIVGATGFEPATSASRTQRSTKLSHAPSYLLTNKSMSVANNNLSQFYIKIKSIFYFITL